jgi:type II secretory pathway predicted ATPase ExeA
MYETHFGFRERPFRPTLDTACYYPAASPDRALTRLLQALRDDEGVVLLTGDPGTGKTLLGHRLLEQLGDGVASAFVNNSHLPNRAALLQAILYDLSQPYEGRTQQELRLTLTDALLRTFGEGRRTVVVVDEAHHLQAELLEELRLLANLEARRARAVQVVLLGQSGLLDTLARPGLEALAQRLAVRAHLSPLDVPEAADYLLHRVRVAGGRPDNVLTEEAVEMLARGCRGVPRLLNQAAHQALTLAYQAGAAVVDAEAALEALVQLGLAPSETEVPAGGFAPEAVEGEADPFGGPLLAGAGEEEPACRLFPSPRPA